MLAKKSLPFEKALCTVKINHMGKGTINARGNQVVETNIIDMIDYRVHFKIRAGRKKF